MANYIIIGGDGKEYGPVTGQEVRQWLAEGRLNAQSLAKAESDAEFRALEKFPEFAGASGIQPPPLAPLGNSGNDVLLSKVKSAATGLKVTAIINLVLAVWGLLRLFFSHPDLQQLNAAMQQMNNPEMQQFMEKLYHIAYGPLGVVNAIFTLAMSGLIWLGASKMATLRSYEFAYTAAILAMIPCLTPCCFLGLPFGIWALVVLNKPGVKSHFT